MSARFSVSEWTAVATVARWTVLLAIVWLAHCALAGRNPRWRVALWRAAVVGIMVVAALTPVPPLLTVRVIPAAREVYAPPIRTSTTNEIQEPTRFEPIVTSRSENPNLSADAAPGSVARRPIDPLLLHWMPLGLWALGASLLAGRLALAWVNLGRIIRRANEAPAWIVERCRDVARAIGAPAVRVRCTSAIATPCLAGLRRPVLLLPAQDLAEADLKAIFAHELAHARGHDLAWNLGTHAATIVLWFHPLAWRIRATHAAACEAVCDAVAAEHLGDVKTYARSLARLALATLAPPPEPGLAMARSTDIGRRVDALERKVFRSPLPRKLALPALLGGCLLLIVIGGVAVTSTGTSRVDATATDPSDLAADDRFELQAVAAATGKPIEGATVDWSLRINGGRYRRTTSSTGPDGKAVLEWPKGATVNTLQVKLRKAGFAPYVIILSDNVHPIRFPALKVLRLVPGITIGGVVRDEAGKAIAGAKVTVQAPPAEAEEAYYRLDLAETTTDGDGRWHMADAPTDLRGVYLTISAPGFLRKGGPVSRDPEAAIVLKRGFTVKGRVLDAAGNPLAGANVTGADNWGSEPKPTTTDTRGEFALQNCPPGPSVVTVQAAGFAPELQEVHPEDQPALVFHLAPGHTVRGKIVDRQGKPIAGATMAADTWRRHRSLDFRVDSDKDGRFEWKDAPEDVILFDFFKAGYMSHRHVAISPAGPEHTITLDPVLVISGRVTDAATGRPVPSFRVVQELVFSNSPRVDWLEQQAAAFSDGQYTIKQSEPYAGYAVRIDADGYKPADSRVFGPGEASLTFDFALTRAAAADLLSGVVLRPDGRPAAGAEVALATPDHPLLFEMEQFRFSRSNGMSFAKTGPDGRFSFGKFDGPFLLAAMSDDGYGEATPEQIADSATISLQAWGKVKGEARIGRQPAAHQIITFAGRNIQPAQPGGVNVFHQIETRTDAQGRFVFDRVTPCAGEVSRVIVTEFGNGSSQHMGCWQEPVDVAPGQTVEVRIGGKGRPVTGRIALKAPPGIHVDWRQNRPATIEKARNRNPLLGFFAQDPRQNERYAAAIDKDGAFRVEDVPPGQYELTVTIDAPPDRDRPGPVQELYRVKVPVAVPEGDDAAPVDLGEIEAEVKGR
jgi:beta-lactamase regulating signal transducer with metallopeptidase domain